jgi:hypothetical protein
MYSQTFGKRNALVSLERSKRRPSVPQAIVAADLFEGVASLMVRVFVFGQVFLFVLCS